jgi:SAM-dependent methyltransferase
MEDHIVRKLLELNRRFYQTFSSQFSNTRVRVQPGVNRVLDQIPLDSKILDLGCGNGIVVKELMLRSFIGDYIGIDSNEELLEIARRRTGQFASFTFLNHDLADPDLGIKMEKYTKTMGEIIRYDVVFSFATLHHLPGRKLHLQVLKIINTLLKKNGRLIISNWQFLNSKRLRERIQDWTMVAIKPDDIEPEDFLLDWRQGGYGLRYAHHFSPEELICLAEQTGFIVIESFLSDGENSNLGLYQVWEKV